jgi:hypothetical protein
MSIKFARETMIEQEQKQRLSNLKTRILEFEKNFAYSQEEAMKKFEESEVAKKSKAEGWWFSKGSYYPALQEVMQEIIKLKMFYKLRSHYEDVMPGGIGLSCKLNRIIYNGKGLNAYLKSKKFYEVCLTDRGLPNAILEEIKNKTLSSEEDKEANPEFVMAIKNVINRGRE